MAIELLNETTFTKDSVTSELISAHCKPIIYYRTSSIATATSVVTLTIGSNSIVLNGLKIDEDATYFYFIVDIDQLLKYFMFNNGITDEFEILTNSFDASSITGNMNINIERFDSGGTPIEDVDFDSYPSHLWHDIPQESGFNLWDVLTMQNIYPQKWCNDSYNALYIYNNGISIQLIDATGKGELIQNFPSAFELTQYKFTKKIQDEYTLRKKVSIYSYGPFDLGNEPLTYTGAQTILSSAIMSPIQAGRGLKSVRLIVDNKNISNTDATTEYVELKVNYTDASSDSEIGLQTYDDGLKNYDFCIKLNTSKTLSSVVATPLGYTGTPTQRSIITGDIRLLLEYDNYANVKLPTDYSLLENGINKITIQSALTPTSTTYEVGASVNIYFDSADKYRPLVWFHRTMGFVSYAFEGLAIEGINTEKAEDISLYFNSLVDVNGLKDSLGKKSFPKITLTTQADRQYWPLLKDLYVNRKVYLWIGKYGDADGPTKWLQVDVSGEYNINNNANKNSAIFEVELTLPQQLNAQY